MKAFKDYRHTFIKKGSEKDVVEAYALFGYKLESFQYVEADVEPWERYIYAFDTNEIFDALGAYPAPARKKPYPFPGYVTMVFSLDKEDPDFAYHYNVYRLYRRVQYDIFVCSERQKAQKKKMIMPLTYWVLYIVICLLGAAAIVGMHFYEQRKINSGLSGILFRPSLISSYFEGFKDFLSCKAYVIGLVALGVGVGLIIFHVLWDLIFHGIKASINKSSKNQLIGMRSVIIDHARAKIYPTIDTEKLRQIENDRGIYSSTTYTSERRRKEDASFQHLAHKQKSRLYAKAQKKNRKRHIRKAKAK